MAKNPYSSSSNINRFVINFSNVKDMTSALEITGEILFIEDFR